MNGPFDGSILQRQYHDSDHADKDHFLFFSLHNDGVEVEKGVSYTPVVIKIQNWSSGMRIAQSGKLLIAVFPPHVKDYQSLLEPVARMFAKHAPGKRPLTVWDAHREATTHVWYIMCWACNDLRAAPYSIMGHHGPCYIGSCSQCVIGALRRFGRMVLIGCVRLLSHDDALRREYAEIFTLDEESGKLASLKAPSRRTKRAALAAGKCICVCVVQISYVFIFKKYAPYE